MKREADRLVELETRLAFQDETLETLNASVVALRDELAALREQVERLKAKLAAFEPGVADGGHDEPPPHY